MAEDQQQQPQSNVDPLLNPGQLRQIVKNLPSKLKHPHSDYHYCDAASFETEITEFFNYSEIEGELHGLWQEYTMNVSFDWCQLDNKDQQRYIEHLLDQLEHSVRDRRVLAAKILLCIALGHCHSDKEPQISADIVITNVNVLHGCGALMVVFHAFNHACKKHDAYNSQNPVMDELGEISNEIGLYISIIYLMLEALRYTKCFSDDLGMLDPSILRSLFEVVSQLRDKYLKSFPVKKLILLLWKAILSTFGGFEELQQAKTASRILHGLEPKNDDIISKCSPQDLFAFQNEITLKYPNYNPPSIPLPITSSLTVKASPGLVKAMGIANATAHTELPYQTLFPPKSSGNSSSTIKKQQQANASLVWPSPSAQSFVLPLDEKHSGTPQSTMEAGNLFLKNMHLSVANHQIIFEREKAIHKWEQWKNSSMECTDSSSKIEIDVRISETMKKRFEALELVYVSMVSELQNIVIVLLKLLLSTVTAGNSSTSARQSSSSTERSANSIDVEETDAARNREILSKAISAILLLLLKWTKVSHVLKFEYLSQLLVDSGCLLLILKILGLQEITTIVAAETDVEGYSIFQQKGDGKISNSSNACAPQRLYTNERNMFWCINFLRILQMLTKRKTNRVMLLVQYKSSAILKRVLKVSHPLMELYALKVMKSQVPYLGRKWRSLNMKIISAIYLRCYTVLRDDWISKSDTDNDLEDGMVQETNLRMLIRIYHGQRYIPAMLPPQDEPSGLDHFTNSINDTIISLGSSILGDAEDDTHTSLDQEFMDNYEEWLENNVYVSEPGEEEDDYIYVHTDSITPGTPIPSSPIAHADSIGSLYSQGLEDAFSSNEMNDSCYGGLDYLDPASKVTQQLFTVEQQTIKRYIALTSDSSCIADTA
ncbi:hypothetical protein BJV82DRAFT_630395 [Fennellomyces sp. T-0311]|nr:hypothetical protein BJV82DRAFT_630395 [Fennellomyces sp. T-0311]